MDFLRALAEIRTPVFDKIFQLITYFGQELAAIGIICIFFWCIDKNFGYKMGFSFFAAGMLVQGLKITFRIDRPWVIDPDFKAVDSALEGATGYSFPSGHTQCSTTMFGSLAFYFKKAWVKVLCVAAFLAVAFSRMYLGVHQPKDIVVAMVTALVTLVIFNYLFDKIKDTEKYDWMILLCLSLVSVGLIVYSLVLTDRGIITLPKYSLDCCKSGGAGLGFAFGWFIERKYVKYDPKTKKIWTQILKVAVGLAVALVLKEIPKALFEDTAVVGAVRYAIVTFWCVAAYPFTVMKILPRLEKDR